MTEKLAPLVLFIYNRPEHTRKTLAAINKNIGADQTVLYVFADGAKENASETDLESIDAARKVVTEQQWCRKVKLTVREANMNLEDNIISGVTEVINKYGKAIVLEDDIVTSPYFLKYCNDGLILYENTKHVFSINGFMFPIDFQTGPEVQTFLSPYATSSWGWATWADRWGQFEHAPNDIGVIETSDFLTKRFNFGEINILNMLKYLNSWDARWYYTAFIKNGIGLFPTKPLTKNIGFDGSGTHSGMEDIPQEIYNLPVELLFQDAIDLNKYAIFQNYFEANPPSIIQRIKNRIKRYLPVILLKKKGITL